jgi:uncharacterized membrane protein YbhN (UPF0104 family)
VRLRAIGDDARLVTPIRFWRWVDRGCLVVAIGLLVFIVTRFPLADVEQAFVQLGPVVLVTPLLALGSMAASAAALGVLAESVGWRALIWNRIVGEGFNTMLPAGVGGEPFKIRHLSQHAPTPVAAYSIVGDYLIDTIVGVAMSAVFFAITLGAADEPHELHAAMTSYVIIATGFSLAGTALLLLGVPGRLGAKLRTWVPSRVAPGKFVRSALLSALARSILLIEIVLLLSLLGIEPTLLRVMFLAGASAAAGYLGFAIPQAIGVTEAATVGAFALLGLPGVAAVAFALARRGRMLLMSFVGLALYVATRKRS